MRISHSQLETARADPANYAPPGDWRLGLSKFRVLQFAAFHYHSSGNRLQSAITYFDQMFNKHFIHGYDDHLALLVEYCDRFIEEGALAFEWNRRIELPLTPSVSMGGTLARLDLRAGGGYRAWLFGRQPAPWEHELRWPLLQVAVARRLNTDPAECSVGFYLFEPAEYEARTYSQEQITAAQTEAARIAELLAGSG